MCSSVGVRTAAWPVPLPSCWAPSNNAPSACFSAAVHLLAGAPTPVLRALTAGARDRGAHQWPVRHPHLRAHPPPGQAAELHGAVCTGEDGMGWDGMGARAAAQTTAWHQAPAQRSLCSCPACGGMQLLWACSAVQHTACSPMYSSRPQPSASRHAPHASQGIVLNALHMPCTVL